MVTENKLREEIWIAVLEGVPVNVFGNRPEAVKWLLSVLKQDIKDFTGQDKPCEYDYEPEIRGLKIIRIKKREAFLGL